VNGVMVRERIISPIILQQINLAVANEGGVEPQSWPAALLPVWQFGFEFKVTILAGIAFSLLLIQEKWEQEK
jgi:hypothetical protein